MKATLFQRLSALAAGLLLATYGCKDKEPDSMTDTAGARTTATLIGELSNVTNQAEAEQVVVQFWHNVYRTRRGRAYSKEKYDKIIAANHRISGLATAHLNYATGKASPTKTLGELLKAYASRRSTKNAPRIPAPDRVIEDLQKQVDAAFGSPESPGSFLPIMIVTARKYPPQAPAVQANTVMSPIQMLSLLLWLSDKHNFRGSLLKEERYEDWGQWEYGLRYTDEEIENCTRKIDELRGTPDPQDECDCRQQVIDAHSYCTQVYALDSEEYASCMNAEQLRELEQACEQCEEAREQRKTDRHRAIGECLEDTYGFRTEGAADQR